ncbi:hypothetical protein SAMN04489761_3541 [Tenacibaculum sp. MAR_2009_124]|uniref:hypothetical protein n=1 Tax=Tenacibaculum sp. MAR_2009_124 TaxID=1250059 RepID=UPI0008952D22|nr:hypothetical protein [Tenacibaculum sp. MAR_2009_124]SEC77507.1 hypothetical protein SAMN04489761_3541 [Tenacibaculum sp. MAR_2009_124]
MILENTFKKLSEKENATFQMQKGYVDLGDGARSPDIYFYLLVNYLDRVIVIKNRIGVSEVGRISCDIFAERDSLCFELNTRDHFTSLFLGKKNRFRMKTRNQNLKLFFKHSSSWKILKGIADKTAFIPSIYGENINGRFILTCEYNMEFKNKEKVLEPLLNLYKEFINQFG